MSKISPEHLARGAYVYVQHSTADQLRNNHESRRRQYGLADRAHALGWSEVVVIDDDLGVSRRRHRTAGLRAAAGGDLQRAGRRRGLHRGLALGAQRPRLAHAAGVCALVGSVIVDEDGVYDPRSVNDRLLPDMKGTMSEMELSLLHQRSIEGLKLKAARGDLHATVAIGYVRSTFTLPSRSASCASRIACALVISRPLPCVLTR